MKSLSIGVAKVTVDSIDLGSITETSIDLQVNTIPIHSAKVGNAMIVADRFGIKNISGTLNVTTEEVGAIRNILDSMLTATRTGNPARAPMRCEFAGADASMTSDVLLLPQISASVNLEGWCTIGLQLPLCAPLNGLSGTLGSTLIGGVPFVNQFRQGAVTTDSNNLCYGVSCNGNWLGELNLSVASQYESIFRGDPPWAVDHVLNSVKVTANLGFYDFSTLTSSYETSSTVELLFHTIGGAIIPVNLGPRCVKSLAGMKTSRGGVNTWHMTVEGNAF